MPSAYENFVVHPALGGLDVTRAPTLLAPDQLTIASNIEYDTSGSRKKRPGTTRFNTTVLNDSTGSAATFFALSDFDRYSASLTPTHRIVAIAGDRIVHDNDTGNAWTSLLTGFGSNNTNVNALIILAQGFAVFSNGVSTPQRWNQTTLSNLGTSAPLFTGASYHLRRLFTVGIPAEPDAVRFSAAGAIDDWTGGDTGFFNVNQNDGDRTVGISEPFHGRLYIFKGPVRGSISEFSGTSPSNSTIAQGILRGAPCVSHKSIITTTSDIFWASRYGFHSLSATQKYGDVEEAYISRPIQTEFRDLVSTRLNQIHGFAHPTRNFVAWAVTPSGQSQNTRLFVYNYLHNLWAIWTFTGFNIASAALCQDSSFPSSGTTRMHLGGYDGFVRKADSLTLTDDDGSAYTARFRTPIYTRLGQGATEMDEKSFLAVTTFLRPKGDYTANLEITVDRRTQSRAISQTGAGDTLG